MLCRDSECAWQKTQLKPARANARWLALLSKNSRCFNTISANWSLRSQLRSLLFWLPFKVAAGHSRRIASWTQVRWKRRRWLLSTQPQLKAYTGSLAHSVLDAWPWTSPYGQRNAIHRIVLHGLGKWEGSQGMARGSMGSWVFNFLIDFILCFDM